MKNFIVLFASILFLSILSSFKQKHNLDNSFKKEGFRSLNIQRATVPNEIEERPMKSNIVDSTKLSANLTRVDFPLLFDDTHLIVLDSTRMVNSSFENKPKRGGKNIFESIKGWFDCGQINFRGESPPDILPTHNNAWDVTKSAIHGNTYLGMAVRDNKSWEGVSQKLLTPLEKGKCYMLSAYLSQSKSYVSASRSTGKVANYNKPTVLRIFGGNGFCWKIQRLAVSEPVHSDDWTEHTFTFTPEDNLDYIYLEAYYKTQSNLPYNGHILLDAMSQIYEVKCE